MSSTPTSSKCKITQCPRLSATFSEYCGEHLPDSAAYLALLTREITLATTSIPLMLQHMSIDNIWVIKRVFDSPSIQQVQFKACVFIDVQLDMGLLQNVQFIDCQFIRCYWVGIELSEFEFVQCRFHRCRFDAHCQIQHGRFDECRFYQLSVHKGSLENVDFMDTIPSTGLSIAESSLIQTTFMRGEIAQLYIVDSYVSDIMTGYMTLPDATFDGVNCDGFEVDPRYCDFRGLTLIDSDIDAQEKTWAQWNNFSNERSYHQFLIDLLVMMLADNIYQYHDEINDIALMLHKSFVLPTDFSADVVDYFTHGYHYFVNNQDYTELGKFVSSFGLLKTHFPDHFDHARLGASNTPPAALPPTLTEDRGYIVISLDTKDYTPAAFNGLLALIDAIYQRISVLGGDLNAGWELLDVSRGSWVITLLGQIGQLLAFKDTVDTSQIKLNRQQLLESKQKQQYYQLATLEKQLEIIKKHQLPPEVLLKLDKDQALTSQIATLNRQSKLIQSSVYDHQGQLISGRRSASKLNIKV